MDGFVPPERGLGGRQQSIRAQPSVWAETPRCGSLLPPASADVRSSGDVTAFRKANDAIRNTSSVGYKLNIEYFNQIVNRYKGRRSVLFWELGNELNLMANLPPPWCGPTKTTGTEPCFNTADMARYTTALVANIRSNDPSRYVRTTMTHHYHTPL